VTTAGGGAEADDRPSGVTAPARTWRPRGVILTAAAFTVLFAVGCVLGWVGLSPEVRASFGPFEIATLALILAALEVVMWLLAGSSVRSDADGLTIRNGWRRHRVAWPEIRRVRLRPGDPWATAELARPADRGADPDGHAEPRTVMLFGIQGSEGASARAAVRELNEYLKAR